jgi:enhancing lycopene biosynthesis protein 2
MTKKIAVILSGCGVRDGSEIHEATISLLAIKKLGADYQCFSLNKEQYQTINHLTGEKQNEKRNVLVESARIARGKIKDLKDFSAKDYDAILFPGGSGAVINLCSYGYEGDNYKVDKLVELTVLSMVEKQKPICSFCISPVIIARILKGVKLTIGSAASVASTINNVGAEHIVTKQGQYYFDENYKVLSSACYMNNISIDELYTEIMSGVGKLLEIC